MDNYTSVAKVKEFGGSSKVSVKIKDSFYVFEASMVKVIPDDINPEDVDMTQEYRILYDELNAEVDEQIRETEEAYYGAK